MKTTITEELLELVEAQRSLDGAVPVTLPIDTDKGIQNIHMMLNVPLKYNYITPIGIQILQSIKYCLQGEVDKDAERVRLGIYGGIFSFKIIPDGFFYKKRDDGKQENAVLVISKDIEKAIGNEWTTVGYPHDNRPECAICLSVIGKGTRAVVLPCHSTHAFHQSCFIGWCWKSDKCPLCNVQFGKSLRTEDILGSNDPDDQGKEQHQLEASGKGC